VRIIEREREERREGGGIKREIERGEGIREK
jgi:hypothetical protein